MFDKILVAIDNSETSQYIFEQALSLAQTTNAQMMLLHILSPLDDPYMNPAFLQPDITFPSLHIETMENYFQAWETLKTERLSWLHLTQKAANTGVKAEFTQTVGDAGRLICETAVNWSADLIIVGRRGRAGLSEFFLGSVSNYVLHHAHCSVLTLQGINPATDIITENASIASS